MTENQNNRVGTRQKKESMTHLANKKPTAEEAEFTFRVNNWKKNLDLDILIRGKYSKLLIFPHLYELHRKLG